jgi:FKBP-type peptidyl-prolyl cis-trans isomerase (trigger factor)
MVYTIIAADNDITVTADEINDQGAQLASQYGYDDYNAILTEYGNEIQHYTLFKHNVISGYTAIAKN